MKKGFWLKVGAATVALSSLLLAGCSSNSSSSNSNSGNSGKKVEVTFWHGQAGPYQKALDEIIKDYNSSQDKYTVKATSQGNYTTLQQKIMASAKSNSLPTISQTTYTTVPDYEKADFIEPLDDYMIKGKEALSQKDQDDIYSTFLSSSKYKGHYYSIPFSKSVRLLFVNDDLLKKYNISEPKTWDDIVAAGQKVKADGISAIGFDKSFDMELNGLVRQAGNPMVTANSLKVNIDTDDTKKATNLIMDMVKDKTALTAGEDIYFTSKFISGKSLFYAGSSAGIATMKKQAPADFKWSTMPLPSFNDKKATEVAGNDIVMYKSASKEQKAGAWDFMKFLISEKETSKWAQATGYVPLRKSVLESADFKKYLKENPTNQAAVDSLPFGFQSTAFVGFNEYRTNVLNTVDSMLTKNTPVNDALKDLQSKTEKIIEDNK